MSESDTTKIRQSDTRSYSEKLKDPRWQKKRLEVLERDDWTCQACRDRHSTLHVHHLFYERGKEPWDSDPETLITLCESCHEAESENMGVRTLVLRALAMQKFLNDEMFALALALRDMPKLAQPRDLALVLAYWIETPELLTEMIDRYDQNVERLVKEG